MEIDKNLIRNFCIIAHIDHGKSTLADRILEITQAINNKEFKEQVLDSMELERERGITIKAKAVRLNFPFEGKTYILNLVDTPGHVDFSYEVAKSLGAVETAVLLVDATQGVEAQTVANYYLATEKNLKIIPAINKIDLAQAQIERTKSQLKEAFGFAEEEISLISAKDGRGVSQLLERIIKEAPLPQGEINQPLRAFLFDSQYDPFKGVLLFVRILEGEISKRKKIKLLSKGTIYEIEELGIFKPHIEKREILTAGEIGVISCNIKDPSQINIPDYITDPLNPTSQNIPKYKRLTPMVFCGIFPNSPKDYSNLRASLEKLRLSDPSFTYEPDNSEVLGPGFRGGFLGLLHMEIIHQRIEREYNLDVILTSPNVRYQIVTKKEETIFIENPQKFPSPSQIKEVREPFIEAKILSPLEYMQAICELAKSKRGIFKKMDYLGGDRLNIIFELPFQEVVIDFYDNIKSITKGYGSLDYEFIGYRKSEIVKVDILFNRNPSGVFSLLVHKDKAERISRKVLQKLKELIPRHVFEINIQAAIGSKIIASEKIPALKKDVTSKCYGGDITRKRKLWEKQKEGKKKLKTLGRVQIPSEAFLEILKI
ncbi:MAG TPA: elongation factor 4 [Candidatus Omnitrophica bacterium]|nr:MAG: elongation factor 4 [Candidatus Omnitrophota bacterium]RKY43656.1 MAG: elongation factor 4 [Candidatus Omnitrophota bacterium]HEC69501.1 elongation factor 4 [Candidatus Omnitrophota bacterium]